MAHSFLLRGARQVLSLRGPTSVRRGDQASELNVIEDGSIFIRDGKIVCIGPTRRVENLKEVRGAIEIPAHNCILMPGFVDSSIHLNLDVQSPLASHRRRKKLSEFFNESVNLMRQCLQHGTSTAVIRASAGVQTLGAELSILRQIARFGKNPVGVTTVWRPQINASGELPEHVANAISGIARLKLARCIELEATSGLSDDLLIKAGDFGAAGMSLHWGGGPVEILAALLAKCSPSSVACNHSLTEAQTALLAKSNVTVVLGVAEALLDNAPDSAPGELIRQGGALALGTGYHACHQPNYNMQFVLALAVKRLKLTIEQAIVSATINAAHAAHRAGEVGSLEPGKHADVLMLQLNDYREIPRRISVNHVAMVFRDGLPVINRTRWRPN